MKFRFLHRVGYSKGTGSNSYLVRIIKSIENKCIQATHAQVYIFVRRNRPEIPQLKQPQGAIYQLGGDVATNSPTICHRQGASDRHANRPANARQDDLTAGRNYLLLTHTRLRVMVSEMGKNVVSMLQIKQKSRRRQYINKILIGLDLLNKQVSLDIVGSKMLYSTFNNLLGWK